MASRNKRQTSWLVALVCAIIVLAVIGSSHAQGTPDDEGLKQMGAFKSRPNAEKLASKLTEAGSLTTIKEKQINAETYFVVYVQTAKPSSAKPSAQPKPSAGHTKLGSFLKLDNATAMAKDMQAAGKDTFICKKKIKKDMYYRVYEKAQGSAEPCADVDAEPLEMASAATQPSAAQQPKPVEPTQSAQPKPNMQKIEKLNPSVRFFINQDAVVYKDNSLDAQQSGIYSDFGGGLVLGTVNDWYVVKFHDKTIGYISPGDTTSY